MKYLTIFASSVFAASLALSGAIAAESGYHGSGSGAYGTSSQGRAGQGASGMGSQSEQGVSGGQQGVGSSSGMSQSGAAQGIDPSQMRQIQQQLSSMGFTPGNVEGQLDAETMEAIRNFQQAQGIQATGQLDVQTLQALGVSGQGGSQEYYGVSPEFDQNQGTIQQSPRQGELPGQQMDQQQLDRGQLNQPVDPSVPQQSQPQGTMGR